MGGYTSSQMAVDHLFANRNLVREPCGTVAGFRRVRPTCSPVGPKGKARRRTVHLVAVRRCLPLVLHIRALPSKWASHPLAAVGQRPSARVTTSVCGVQPTTAIASWLMPTGRPCLVRVLCACYWFRCTMCECTIAVSCHACYWFRCTLCECTIAVSCRACYWSRCPLCECTIAVSCRVNSAAHPDGGALDTALGRQSRHEGLLPVLVLHVPASQDRLFPAAPPQVSALQP